MPPDLAYSLDEVTQLNADPFAALNALLSDYNASHIGKTEHTPLWLFARDAAAAASVSTP